MSKPVSDTHCEFRSDFWNKVEVYSTVIDSDEFMDHRLVGPLGEQRGYWIVSSVKDQEQRRNLRQTEVK